MVTCLDASCKTEVFNSFIIYITVSCKNFVGKYDAIDAHV